MVFKLKSETFGSKSFSTIVKKVTNFSTKTTFQLLMQTTPHAPANLENRSLFDHGALSQQTLYQTDELSSVRAMLKHQLTNRYRYRTHISLSRNPALAFLFALQFVKFVGKMQLILNFYINVVIVCICLLYFSIFTLFSSLPYISLCWVNYINQMKVLSLLLGFTTLLNMLGHQHCFRHKSVNRPTNFAQRL